MTSDLTPTPARSAKPPKPKASLSTGDSQALALNFSVAIRTAGYYDADNAVLQEVVAALWHDITEHCEDTGRITIGIHSRCVFVDGARVRTSISTFERFAFLDQLFGYWGINTVTFHAGITEVGLTEFLLLLARETGGTPDSLTRLLEEREIRGIDVNLQEGGGTAQTVTAIEAYAAAVQMGEELRETIALGERPNVRHVRHVTQAVVDQIMEDPRVLIALTTIKEHDESLISHSANVAILSVLIGQRLGLSKTRLGELCLAAFLHDAGKLEVSPEVLYKPGPLDDVEWEEMRSHPCSAARSFLGTRHLTAPTMRSVVVAFEHHLNFDMSGYPPTRFKKEVSLFGSIVTIADRYDALTTPRPYRKEGFTPHDTLAYLIHHSGTFFDPVLVKLFIEMMGLYPPGTVVGLNTGEWGVVSEPPLVGSPLDRPKVRLIGSPRAGQTVSLDETKDGEYVLSIVRMFNPAREGQMPAVDLSTLTVDADEEPALLEGGTADVDDEEPSPDPSA